MTPRPAAPDTDDVRSNVIRFAIGESSLGWVLVARSETGIAAVLIGNERDPLRQDLRARFPKAVLMEDAVEQSAITARVIRFIESPGRTLDVSLDLRGTEFQQKVWRELRHIPAGETATYTEIANRLGQPRAVRAIAQACAANPLAVLVPCHRVVRSDGELAGYRWGVERKRALLDREATASNAAATQPSRLESSTAVAHPDRSSPEPTLQAPR